MSFEYALVKQLSLVLSEFILMNEVTQYHCFTFIISKIRIKEYESDPQF